jgi:hypothetical protein
MLHESAPHTHPEVGIMTDQNTNPETTDDTEGHRSSVHATEAPSSPDADDTEGHRSSAHATEAPSSPDADDTEGHRSSAH